MEALVRAKKSYKNFAINQGFERPTSSRTRRKGWPNRRRRRARSPPRSTCSSSYLVAASGTSTRATPARIDRIELPDRRAAGTSSSQASTKEPTPVRFRLASRRIVATRPSIPLASRRRTRWPRSRSRPAAATARSAPVRSIESAFGADGDRVWDLDSRGGVGMRSPPVRLTGSNGIGINITDRPPSVLWPAQGCPVSVPFPE